MLFHPTPPGPFPHSRSDKTQVKLECYCCKQQLKDSNFDLYVNLEGQHMLISSWSQK